MLLAIADPDADFANLSYMTLQEFAAAKNNYSIFPLATRRSATTSGSQPGKTVDADIFPRVGGPATGRQPDTRDVQQAWPSDRRRGEPPRNPSRSSTPARDGKFAAGLTVIYVPGDEEVEILATAPDARTYRVRFANGREMRVAEGDLSGLMD